jgi:putative transposase
VKGCKRHLIVDTLGKLVAVLVTPANLSDKEGLRSLLPKVPWFSRWKAIVVDGGYESEPLKYWCENWFKIDFQVVKRSETANGYALLPKRWVVERTVAWLGNYRRLSKDYEFAPSTSEAMLYAAMVHLMARRLGGP